MSHSDAAMHRHSESCGPANTSLTSSIAGASVGDTHYVFCVQPTPPLSSLPPPLLSLVPPSVQQQSLAPPYSAPSTTITPTASRLRWWWLRHCRVKRRAEGNDKNSNSELDSMVFGPTPTTATATATATAETAKESLAAAVQGFLWVSGLAGFLPAWVVSHAVDGPAGEASRGSFTRSPSARTQARHRRRLHGPLAESVLLGVAAMLASATIPHLCVWWLCALTNSAMFFRLVTVPTFALICVCYLGTNALEARQARQDALEATLPAATTSAQPLPLLAPSSSIAATAGTGAMPLCRFIGSNSANVTAADGSPLAAPALLSPSSPSSPSSAPHARPRLHLRALGFGLGYLAIIIVLIATHLIPISFAYYSYDYQPHRALTCWLIPSSCVAGVVYLLLLFSVAEHAALGTSSSSGGGDAVATTPTTSMAVGATSLDSPVELRSLVLSASSPSVAVPPARRSGSTSMPAMSPVQSASAHASPTAAFPSIHAAESLYVSWIGLWIVTAASYTLYLLLLVSLLVFVLSLLYYAALLRDLANLAAIATSPCAITAAAAATTTTTAAATAAASALPLNMTGAVAALTPAAEKHALTLLLRLDVLLSVWFIDGNGLGCGCDGLLATALSMVSQPSLLLSTALLRMSVLYTEVALPIGIGVLMRIIVREVRRRQFLELVGAFTA